MLQNTTAACVLHTSSSIATRSLQQAVYTKLQSLFWLEALSACLSVQQCGCCQLKDHHNAKPPLLCQLASGAYAVRRVAQVAAQACQAGGGWCLPGAADDAGAGCIGGFAGCAAGFLVPAAPAAVAAAGAGAGVSPLGINTPSITWAVACGGWGKAEHAGGGSVSCWEDGQQLRQHNTARVTVQPCSPQVCAQVLSWTMAVSHMQPSHDKMATQPVLNQHKTKIPLGHAAQFSLDGCLAVGLLPCSISHGATWALLA